MEFYRMKKNGLWYVFFKHDENDYELWISENTDYENDGYSIRGTKEEIKRDMEEIETTFSESEWNDIFQKQ